MEGQDNNSSSTSQARHFSLPDHSSDTNNSEIAPPNQQATPNEITLSTLDNVNGEVDLSHLFNNEVVSAFRNGTPNAWLQVGEHGRAISSLEAEISSRASHLQIGFRFGSHADPNLTSLSMSQTEITQTTERLFNETLATLRSHGPVPVHRLHEDHDSEGSDLYDVSGENNDEEYVEDETIDVDNISYEELSELGDQIGNVNTGLSEEAIVENLRQRTYQSITQETPMPDNNQEDAAICCICQEEFNDGEELGELINCNHKFHVDCIKQWLMEKNSCPICKRPALAV